MMAIPSAITYKDNSKKKSVKLSSKALIKLKEKHPDSSKLKDLRCPTPGCMARLIVVIGKHSYIRSAPNNKHSNDHVKYCPYKVSRTGNGASHHKVPAYVSEEQISRSDNYFLRKLGPKHKSHTVKRKKKNNKRSKETSNNKKKDNVKSKSGKAPTKSKNKGNGSRRHTNLRHRRPDTLGPSSLGGLIFGGFLKHVDVQSNYIIFIIGYNNVSKKVTTSNKFFLQQSSIVYEVKENKSHINTYLRNHRMLFVSYVTINKSKEQEHQVISLNDYDDMKFNIYGHRRKLTCGQAIHHITSISN